LLAELAGLVAQGGVDLFSTVKARAFELLDPKAFPFVADYHDSVLAVWMFKLEFAGKPVILHSTRTCVTTSG